MSRRATIRQSRLDALESEFRPLLLCCLQDCVNSRRYGLFGQNPEGTYWRWPEAERLRDIAQKILEIRSEFGSTNWLCDRFAHFCSLRGPSVPGEPKLAAQLLEEVEARNAFDLK